MSNELVTVATFPEVWIAHLVRQKLEMAGIRAYLADENMGSLLGDLIGVKLQVAKEDVLRATAVLEAESPPEPPPSEDIMVPEQSITQRDPIAAVDPDDEIEEQERLHAALTEELVTTGIENDPGIENNRCRLAARALTAAVVGIFICPVQLYATWLLFEVWFSQEPLTERAQPQLLLAALINVPFLLLLLLAIYSLVAP